MRAACALRIFSGRIIFISRLSRSAERSKRIFTGGVVKANGICHGQNKKAPEGGCSPGKKGLMILYLFVVVGFLTLNAIAM